jgi:hypothetical protein
MFALTLAAALGVAASAPAFAQSGPSDRYGDPVCGAWVNGVWQDNGQCPGYVAGPQRTRISGTITFVRGHLVTVQLADKQLVINDEPALYRETTGRVAVGRQIVAFGYWRDGSFYATEIE